MLEKWDQYNEIAKGIAALLHPFAEVVVHDLKKQRIVILVNNFSKRKIGSPTLLEYMEFTPGQWVIGPYEKINWDGRKLKSISVILRNSQGTPEAIMCINLDVSAAMDIHQRLELFIQPNGMIEQPEALFKDDWHEKINQFVNNWLSENNRTIAALNINEKRKLVELLYEQGAFRGKQAARYVASVLCLGNSTVYKYLKEMRK
ncbi:transcriptional regulator [Thermodesulfobacteriota bacterium]